MCGRSLVKVKRPNLITPTYNESSSVRACWSNPCTQQALKSINLQRNNHNNQKKKKDGIVFLLHMSPHEAVSRPTQKKKKRKKWRNSSAAGCREQKQNYLKVSFFKQKFYDCRKNFFCLF